MPQTQRSKNTLGQGDLFSVPDNPKQKRRVYSVTEVTRDIKLILENTFSEVWIEGEVSGFIKTIKGIMFFSLKDSESLIKCVIFNSSAANIKFEIKDGLSLVCCGRISVYEKDGRYQLYVQQVEPKGVGSLQLALEQLKEKLEKEGLFSPEHKRPMPYLPSRIGVVTSLTGAAIKDILKVLDRRFRDINLVIRPAQVQGEGAKEDIAQAIVDFNKFNQGLPKNERVEVLIVGRGGGSIEDLWAFNEEIVARAIYNSGIPVISAVGHERDWSIADLVADLRAPTPSVAAEVVIPKKEDLRQGLEDAGERLAAALSDTLSEFKGQTDDLRHRLSLSANNIWRLNAGVFEAARKKLSMLNPAALIEQHLLKVSDLTHQIYVRFGHFLKLKEAGFHTAVEKLSSLSPLNILGRGYSITFKLADRVIVKDCAGIAAGDEILTRLHRGEIISQVKEVKNNGGS